MRFGLELIVWPGVVGAQPQPSPLVVMGSAVVALLLVCVRSLWGVARNVVTIAHEGGHGLTAVLVGRRLYGIRLHSDTSGVAISRGKPTGPGMVWTTALGYPAPSLIGLGFAGLLAAGRISLMLWITVGLLACVLMVVRNGYGVLAVLVTCLTLGAVTVFAPPAVRGASAYLLTWFLLFGAIRPVGELQRKRYQGQARNSDADQLAALTGLPALLWVLIFGLIGIVCLALAGTLLLPLPPGSWHLG